MWLCSCMHKLTWSWPVRFHITYGLLWLWFLLERVFIQAIMWFGVWLNYFQCQMSSDVCVPTWTYIPIALMLLPFTCYVVLCKVTSRWFDCGLLRLRTFKCFMFIHFSPFILSTLTVIARGRFLVCCKYYLSLSLPFRGPIYIKKSYDKLRPTCRSYDTIRYEMLFYVRSKANMSQLNVPHGTDN